MSTLLLAYRSFVATCDTHLQRPDALLPPFALFSQFGAHAQKFLLFDWQINSILGQ
jgi:hypothetical protein